MTGIALHELLAAYANGIFPMSEDRDDPTLFWVDPEFRGVLPLESFHIPKRLKKTVKQDHFEIKVDTAFQACVEECSRPRPDRRSTWINDSIIHLYSALYDHGFAHSVEAWLNGRMVGGLYGVSLGAAFFGESMFSLERDASKVALVHLVARLKNGGFSLLDTQFVTEHLIQFGAVEIPRARYKALLAKAVSEEADFYGLPATCSGSMILQSMTQTS